MHISSTAILFTAFISTTLCTTTLTSTSHTSSTVYYQGNSSSGISAASSSRTTFILYTSTTTVHPTISTTITVVTVPTTTSSTCSLSALPTNSCLELPSAPPAPSSAGKLARRDSQQDMYNDLMQAIEKVKLYNTAWYKEQAVENGLRAGIFDCVRGDLDWLRGHAGDIYGVQQWLDAHAGEFAEHHLKIRR
ncbi:hypothetical protein ACMFMG_004552 [Clarireedia jacksonii]